MGELAPANVLILCSDQHSRHILGCYGNPVVRTPHLDALAARGTRFANAYTPSPICVPARACLATGRYAHDIECWDNAAPYDGTAAPSWGQRLVEQGHHVTTIGKLHYADGEIGFPDQRLAMHSRRGAGLGILREKMPVLTHTRDFVAGAGPGEPEYSRYDRAVGAEAARWLCEEGPRHAATGRPWALFVSFVYPHFPLVVPEAYWELYPPESVPLPACWAPEEWTRHPVLAWMRWVQGLDTPFEEATVRRALAAYYGMVTHLDEQVGLVLAALRESGQEAQTRVVYTSDHGDMMGEHGLWFKSVMYDGAAGVPLLLAGPGVPQGKVCLTNVSLVDIFPTVLESVRAAPAPEDALLPGRSLVKTAREPDAGRAVFSEYHDIYSPTASFMLRRGRHKYVHYVGEVPQLFDLELDPGERDDLAQDPRYAAALASCRASLNAICDPEEVNRRARADQQQRIEEGGGVEVIASRGSGGGFSRAPEAFRG